MQFFCQWKQVFMTWHSQYHIYHTYSNRHVWANSAQPDQTQQNIGQSALFAIYPVVLDTSTGSKKDWFEY